MNSVETTTKSNDHCGEVNIVQVRMKVRLHPAAMSHVVKVAVTAALWAAAAAAVPEAGATGGGSAAAGAVADDTRKNVLWIMVDDLRPDINFGFGAVQMHTPNLDALARESLVLSSHHAQIAVCGPTRASLLVSRRPDTLRTVAHTTFPTYWRERAGNFTSIPQHFRDNGWYTESIGKVYDLRTSSSDKSPADLCDGPYSWSVPAAICDSKDLGHADQQSGGASHKLLTAAEEADMTDVKIASAAVARLGATAATWDDGDAGGDGGGAPLPSPWFLGVGFLRPHLPFIVPQRHLDLYPANASLRLPWNRFAPPVGMPSAASECSGTFDPKNPTTHGCVPHEHSFEIWQQYSYGTNSSATAEEADRSGAGANRDRGKPVRPGWGGWHGVVNTSLPDEMTRELVRYYYAAVSHTDELIGRVLAALSARLDANNTVVAFVSDHGWHLSEQSMWAKCTNFEAATRAPAMLRLPGLTTADAGGAVVVNDALTEHVDIGPTVCEAAGAPLPPTCPDNSTSVMLCTEGTSLLPLLPPGRLGAEPRGAAKTVADAASPSLPPAVAAAAAAVDILSLGPSPRSVKRAAFSQWPHPFAAAPLAMGYTMRTHQWRFTEWVPMSYPGGVHTPDWTRQCGRELYFYGTGPGSLPNGTSAQETENLAYDPAYASTVELLRTRLVAGWRSALGPSNEWPQLPAPPPAVAMESCPFGVWNASIVG